MNDFFLRVYLLSQLTRYRLAILRLIPGPSVHYSLIENPVVFPWYLRGLGGGCPRCPLLFFWKNLFQTFWNILSGKRTVCLGIASSLKWFFVVCKIMFLSLEFIWPKFSCGTNLRVFPVYSRFGCRNALSVIKVTWTCLTPEGNLLSALGLQETRWFLPSLPGLRPVCCQLVFESQGTFKEQPLGFFQA